MADTQKRGTPVPIAVLLVVLAAAVLAASAFYALGGGDLITALFARSPQVKQGSVVPVKPTPSPKPTLGSEPESLPSAEPQGLDLPSGMTERQALRLWQEQVDSQANIVKLVDGKVRELTFQAAEEDGDRASVRFRATFSDGSSAPGTFVMSKSGDLWFLEYVSGMRRTSDVGALSDTVNRGRGEEPKTSLPDPDEVDVEVLNAVLDAQAASQHVFEDYLSGNMERVVVDDVKKGANTATIKLTMHEADETVKAEVVCLSREFRGERLWFLAAFERVSSE
ncbi:MAG: hypothetical protein IBX63_04455 [Coriobacteriia bacterium]|nr:hypothetical protein [Coriobacteriia bacterium]